MIVYFFFEKRALQSRSGVFTNLDQAFTNLVHVYKSWACFLCCLGQNDVVNMYCLPVATILSGNMNTNAQRN
jgi:hypothetical protein